MIRVLFPRRLLFYIAVFLSPVLAFLGLAFYVAGWVGLVAAVGAYLVAGVAVRYFLVDLGGKVIWTTRGNHAASGLDAARYLEGQHSEALARSMNHARRLLSLFVIFLWPLYVVVWRSGSRS